MRVSLAYMAGMVDADGHFVWRDDKNQAADIGVTNTSQVLMDSLVETFGGSYGTERRTCEEGCTKDHIHRRSDIMRWHVTGYRAVLLAQALLPYLVIKVDKAQQMMDNYVDSFDRMERPARRLHHMAKELEDWKARGHA